MGSIVVGRNFLNALRFARQFATKQYLALMSMENVLVYALLHAEKNIARLNK